MTGKPKQINILPKKVILVANTLWYIQNFRLKLIEELRARNIEVVALAPEGALSRSQELRVRCRNLKMNRRSLNPLSDLMLLARFYEVYREEKPDVVFHNTIKPVIFGSIAARLLNVKHINMIPGLGYVFTGRQFARRGLRVMVKLLYRFALAKSHCVFFQNPDDKEYFVSNGLVDKDKIEITFGSGVDLEHFNFVERRPIKGECTFLLIGRMLWDKGVGEFVNAAKETKKLFPHARFQLLGMIDKDNRSHITRKTIDDWANSGLVEYLGEVSDVRPILHNADVVVLPSYYREGVPKSLLEAMAMGKPIVTTDMPGCRETVLNGVNGLMIPAKDERALCEAMQFMVTQPDRRIEMGRQSRRLAIERFDVKRVNRMFLDSMQIT